MKIAPHRRGAWKWRAAVPFACTCLLLAGILVDRLLWRRPGADAAPYHRQVQEAAANIPLHFDKWLGVDVPVPQGAVNLLKPNVLVSRRYQDMDSGRTVTLLLVQCTDARDLLGHYPPVCYAGQGWQLVSAEPRDWESDDGTVHGTRYRFKTGAAGFENQTTIDNFMVLPGGATARNMEEVHVAAQDRRRKHFGAAQVQIVYGSDVSEPTRLEVFRAFLSELNPTMTAIARPVGVKP
jgi:EpsI family protein